MIEIEFYETEDGKCPLEEYLDSLEPKLLAKTLRTIDLLENNGTSLRGPYSEPLGMEYLSYGRNKVQISQEFYISFSWEIRLC